MPAAAVTASISARSPATAPLTSLASPAFSAASDSSLRLNVARSWVRACSAALVRLISMTSLGVGRSRAWRGMMTVEVCEVREA